MSDLIDTTEMYLKVIWELGEDHIPPLRARLTERLDHTVPTVSQTVARMERDGLLALREGRLIELSPLGRGYAMRVMRKHRLSELLLLEVIGLEFEFIHDEACRWEHVISRKAEERIARLVSDPTRDPFGNPIPGLGELGIERDPQVHPQFGRGVLGAGLREATLVRIGEPVHARRDVVREFRAAGLLPGALVEVEVEGDALTLRVGDATMSVGNDVAKHVFVL